jgi:uncharacterized protein (DUF1697 family)
MKYAALLRGIGPGNPKMRNENLRRVLEELGFENVQSVISSGNLLFEADKAKASDLEDAIEAAWPEKLGFESTTIVRSHAQLLRLVAGNPFGDRPDDESSRLQTTFLKTKPRKKLDLPHSSDEGDYEIVAIVARTICSTVDLSGPGTPELMRWLERTFGREMTTRTWKSVNRIVRRLEEAAPCRC